MMDDALQTPSWSEVVRDTFDLLTFRISHERLAGLGLRHLYFGFFCTWIVGMGRYWDDPGAKFLQHLGVGSLVYVVVLALFLWLIITPLRPEGWSYRTLLTFVVLTSPPAILYAIPVELYFELSTAASINVWFLATVATWRVAILVFYLRRLAKLTWLRCVVGTFLPLTAIVFSLTVLNLERAVFDVMGGLHHTSASDAAYEVLVILTVLSGLLLPIFALAWIGLVLSSRRNQSRGTEG